ncbi:hypothetical protein WJ74_16380 [Burkholderia ubonensis]|nr:transposase domain-containing protein [Burkholderia ubonensis]KVO11053.1 hypothetical protein WJ74_16380 [Burkholderia ubonensis]
MNASANLYSLVETCKVGGIDSYRYLIWLFQRLPLAKTGDDYDALLRLEDAGRPALSLSLHTATLTGVVN